MSRRRSEWHRYRKSEKVRGMRDQFEGLAQSKKATEDRIPFLSKESADLRQSAKLKEIEIKNSAAPLSIGERHYPKEFTIGKPEGEE